MKKQGLLFLAWKNLKQHPWRNGLLLLCVLAVSGMQMMTSLIDGATRRGVDLGIRRLGANLVAVPRGLETKTVQDFLNGKANAFYMDAALEDEIKALGFVARTSPQLYVRSLSSASCCSMWNVFLIGFDPETDFTVKPWLPPRNRQGAFGPEDVLVGAAVSVEPGTLVTFFGNRFRVAGTLEPSGTALDTAVFMPMENARNMIRGSARKAEKPLTIADDQISAVFIELKPASRGGLPAWKAAYQLEKAIAPISIIQPADVVRKAHGNLTRTYENLYATSCAVWGMTFLLMAFVFAMAVRERQREIGLLRSMGATRGFVFRMVVSEVLMVSGLGAFLGVLASVGVVLGLVRRAEEKMLEPLLFPPLDEIAVLSCAVMGMALAVGVSSALVPAVLASLREPYEAVRSRGS